MKHVLFSLITFFVVSNPYDLNYAIVSNAFFDELNIETSQDDLNVNCSVNEKTVSINIQCDESDFPDVKQEKTALLDSKELKTLMETYKLDKFYIEISTPGKTMGYEYMVNINPN